MKNLFLLNKSVLLLILLLPFLGQLKAEELTIKEFSSLQNELQKRIKANEAQPGKTFRNLNLISSKFKETYKDSIEINEMIQILSKALDTIKSNNEDREIVLKINDVFTANLKTFINKTDIPQSTIEPDSIKMLNGKIIKLQEDIDRKYSIIWWIIPSCLGLLFLGLTITFFIKNKKKLVVLKELEDKKEVLKSENKNLQNSLTDIKRTDSSNQQQQVDNVMLISELRRENAELKEALKPKINEISDNKNQTAPTPPAKVYYFSTPQPDGSFNDSNKSDLFIATSSMYKFTLLSNNKANFEFINDESTLRDALNYPDSYLLPVCRAENTRNIKATKIATIGKGGIAELSNGRWTVTEKAVIRYD